VTFKIAVNEGLQYRMGTVEFKGVSPVDAALLAEKWTLKSGEVYDRTYTARFFRVDASEIMSRIARERQAQGKPLPNIDTQERPNSQTLMVNLTVQIKD
jgi:outer membrane protein assembly factor BamA